MPETTQQLKADIDTGRTGDKVPAWDPGLVMLGTDDEAAGSPNSPEQVAAARRMEMANAPSPPLEQAALASGRGDRYVRVFKWVIAGTLLLLAAAFVVALVLRSGG